MLMFVLLLAAFIVFAIEVFRSRGTSLIAIGLALFTLAFVVGAWPGS